MCALFGTKCDTGPADDQGLLRIETSEGVEDERRPNRRGHVVTRVTADGLRQVVHGELRRERVNQVREGLVRELRPVGFAMMAGDQRPQDAQRLRRPSDRSFVNVPAPRRSVVAPGEEAQMKRDHRLFLILHRGDAVCVPIEFALVADSPDEVGQIGFQCLARRR